MKTILSLLVAACVGLVAVGCDPAPKDEPSSKTDAKTPLPAKSAAPEPEVKPSK